MSTVSGPTTARPRILLVDDDLLTLESMAELVRSDGCDPVVARSVEGALARIRESRPDALVTDLDLSGTSGLALVRAVRATPGVTAIPVFVVSGREAARGRAEAAAAGADAFFTKPVDFDDLLAELRRRLDVTRRPKAESSEA